MPIPESFLQELTARSDIVDVVSGYVRLTKKSGSNLFGLCPFHSEKTPSFSVAPDKQIYHCFGCGKGGGVISFIMEIENLSFADAVAFLARRAGLEVPQEGDDGASQRRRRLLEANREAARWFYEQFKGPGGAPARDYAAKRGLTAETVKRFGLGFAPDGWSGLLDTLRARGFTEQELFDAGLMKHGKRGGGYDAFRNRLMFPVIDVRGAVIGFSGRILGEGEPKYLNSPETPVFSKSRHLYAMNLAKKSKNGYIILSEGNIDVVMLHQAGFDSAVASLGTSLTPEQARLIKNYANEVVIAYDGDAAGMKAAHRAIGILEKLDLRVRVLTLQDAKDPDEFIRAKGAEAFRRELEGSAGRLDYKLRLVEAKHELETDEGRVAFVREAVAMLAALPSAVEREIYADKVASRAKLSQEAVLRVIADERKKLFKSAKRQEERDAIRPVRTAQPRARGLRYENVISARAEEGVIHLIYNDPSICRNRVLPPPERFSSPLLGRFYAELLCRAQQNESMAVDLLAGVFSPDELSHLTAIVQGPVNFANSEKELHDYIDIIEKENLGTAETDLRAMAEKYRQTKGYGG